MGPGVGLGSVWPPAHRRLLTSWQPHLLLPPLKFTPWSFEGSSGFCGLEFRVWGSGHEASLEDVASFAFLISDAPFHQPVVYTCPQTRGCSSRAGRTLTMGPSFGFQLHRGVRVFLKRGAGYCELLTHCVGQGLGRKPIAHSDGATKGEFNGLFKSLGKSVKNVTYLVLSLAEVGSFCHPRPEQPG